MKRVLILLFVSDLMGGGACEHLIKSVREIKEDTLTPTQTISGGVRFSSDCGNLSIREQKRGTQRMSHLIYSRVKSQS